MLPRERETADHRVISRILQLSHGQSNPKPELINLISRLFTRVGGSWVEFFKGDPYHAKLLKRCASAVIKKDKEAHERRRRRHQGSW